MPILASNRASQNTQSAIDAENQYYNNAAAYMGPYTQNAGTDFNTGRNLIYSAGSKRLAGPRYGQNPFKYIQSPSSLLQQGQASFQANPAEQFKLGADESKANSVMNSEGMYGSADNAALDAAINNVATSADMANYLKELSKSAGDEMGLTKDYENQNKMIGELFKNLNKLEYGASSTMAENAMRAGQQESESYNRETEASRFNNPINTLIGAAGTGFGIYERQKTMKNRQAAMRKLGLI